MQQFQNGLLVGYNFKSPKVVFQFPVLGIRIVLSKEIDNNKKKKTLYSIADLGPALSIPRYMDIGQAGATLLYFSYFLKSELELPC